MTWKRYSGRVPVFCFKIDCKNYFLKNRIAILNICKVKKKLVNWVEIWLVEYYVKYISANTNMWSEVINKYIKIFYILSIHGVIHEQYTQHQQIIFNTI